MSSFCVDLSSVGMSTEFDGSPDALASGAQTLRTSASSLDEAARNIRMLTEQGSELESEAFGALAEKSRDLHGTLAGVALRYRMMATAAQNFSDVLRTEQGNALRLLDEAAGAQRAYSSARGRHEYAKSLARDPDPTSQQRAVELAQRAGADASRANATLMAAKQQLLAAAGRIKEANETASGVVRTAMEMSGLNDSFWEKLAYLGGKIAEVAMVVGTWIWDHIDTICLVLDVLSLVLMFIPGIGTVAGGAIKLAVGLIKVLTTVAHTISKVKMVAEIGDDALEGRWDQVGSGVLKFGLSFAIGKAAKGISTSRWAKSATARIANKLFSHGGQGRPEVLYQTTVGRGIHNLGEYFGGPTFPAGTPLPTNFLTQHIERTTRTIRDGLTKTGEVVIKNTANWALDQVFKKPVSRRTQCLTTAGTTL